MGGSAALLGLLEGGGGASSDGSAAVAAGAASGASIPYPDLRHLLRFSGGPAAPHPSPPSSADDAPPPPPAPASAASTAAAAPVDPGSTAPAHAVGPILAKAHRAPTADEADLSALNLHAAGARWEGRGGTRKVGGARRSGCVGAGEGRAHARMASSPPIAEHHERSLGALVSRGAADPAALSAALVYVGCDGGLQARLLQALEAQHRCVGASPSPPIAYSCTPSLTAAPRSSLAGTPRRVHAWRP